MPAFRRNRGKARRDRLSIAWVCALVAYLGALYVVTLTGDGTGAGPRGNVVPFASIVSTWTDSVSPLIHRLIYLLGNLILLVPLAVAALIARPAIRGGRVVLICAIFAASIEIVQWLFIDGRAGDIDDVILNTLGVVIVVRVCGDRVRLVSSSPPLAASAGGGESLT